MTSLCFFLVDVIVHLSGPGGKLVVFETSKAGRLTDGVYPSFINGVQINFANIHQKRKDEEALFKMRKPQIHIGTLGTGKHLFPISEN